MNSPTSSSNCLPPLAVAALCLTLCFWASAFVAIRAALPGFSPGHLACLRFFTASICLIPMVVWYRCRHGAFPIPALRDVPGIFLHGFLGYYVYHMLLNMGEQTVTGASAAFLIGAIPVCSTFLAAIFLKEPLHRRALVGLGISMLGVTTIAMGEGGGLTIDHGALLVLGAAFGESIYFVSIKSRLARYGSLPYTIYTMWAGTLIISIHFNGLGGAIANAPPEAFWSVIYLGVCPAALGYVFWNYALSQAQVGWLASTQFSQPFLAICIGLVWLGEMPGLVAVLGGLVAILGAAITTGQLEKLKVLVWRKRFERETL